MHIPFNNPGNANTNLISGEIQLMFQLVTGGSSGIGESTARALLARGFTVYAVARRVDRMAALEAEGPSAWDEAARWFAAWMARGAPADFVIFDPERPGRIDENRFRQVMGRFASGVTVGARSCSNSPW